MFPFPDEVPKKLVGHMSELEIRIMDDIVRRIRINSEITRAADWQINRLHELGVADETVKKYIANALKLSDADVDKLYSDVIPKGYATNEKLYTATGKEFIPFSKNLDLKQATAAMMTQTKGELKNITQSLGFMVDMGGGKIVYTPLSDVYQHILDGAMLDITSGTFDYNTVIKRVVNELTNSGLRTVDYANGWCNRIDVAVRRAVMTGMNQITGKISEYNAEQLETEYFEVSYHVGARNTGLGYNNHQAWQGKVYTKDELVSICGLGYGGGLKGWNCSHDYSPFVPGASERVYTDEELAEMNAKENQKKSYLGKEYDTYEASQRQRKLETLMRAQREKIKLLESGGADEDTILTAKARYRVTSHQYSMFSKIFNLPQQRNRVYVDNIGKIT